MDKDANFHLLGQLNTEFNTITSMIDLYCLHHHQPNTGKFQRCADCEQFRAYVKQRLDRCPYGEKNRVVNSALFIAISHNKSLIHKQSCAILALKC